MKKTILIVDDEADIRNLVKEILEDEGYATLTAANSKEVYALLEDSKPDMAVLDIWLQDSRHDGLQILETIKASEHAEIPVIMISGHGTIETAVTAIKQGAYDFIEKPFKSDRLLLMVRRGLEAAGLAQENAVLRAQSHADVQIVGDSSYAKSLSETVQGLAASNSRALIKGPLGAGKTTIARLIHNQSVRAHEPFLIHACVDDEGQQDALSKSFVDAKDGTLVLQDACALDSHGQKALLSLLQSSSYSARIIATVRDVEKLDKDLYQRLSVEVLELLPLVKRQQDIEAFAEFFLKQACVELGLSVPKLSREVVQSFERYSWPGNLYEMQAVIVSALVHSDGSEVLSGISLPQNISGAVQSAANVEVLHTPNASIESMMLDLPLREARDVFEREYLTSQVDRFEGNISKTAQFIGMERSALHRKIKSLQDKEDKGEPSEPQAASIKN